MRSLRSELSWLVCRLSSSSYLIIRPLWPARWIPLLVHQLRWSTLQLWSVLVMMNLLSLFLLQLCHTLHFFTVLTVTLSLVTTDTMFFSLLCHMCITSVQLICLLLYMARRTADHGRRLLAKGFRTNMASFYLWFESDVLQRRLSRCIASDNASDTNAWSWSTARQRNNHRNKAPWDCCCNTRQTKLVILLAWEVSASR